MPNLETIGSLAWLIPTFTFAAFVAIVTLVALGRGGRVAGTIGVAGIAASAVVGLLVFAAAWGAGGHGLAEHPFMAGEGITWAVFGTDTVTFGWLIDPLSAAMVAMVTVVCSMIFIYATGYMETEFTNYVDPKTGEIDRSVGAARYARFFAYISLFATGMLGFVLSSNLLQAVIFWEIMGVCSFLLIGFWYYKPSAAAAAKKAFMTTRIGDTLMLVGVFCLYWVFGTLDYSGMLSPEATARLAEFQIPGLALPATTLFALLIFGGAVGKSAQFPLHVWLPDAMEGPTPVSALIHAATMVAAGVFLVARLYPVFNAGGEGIEAITPAMWVVAGIGAFTALFAATIAVAQFDIKRVLAYSTISQLGYMIMALGIGAWVAAVFHVITHAFFKALLFLGSGSVIHGVEHGFHHASHDHDGPELHDAPELDHAGEPVAHPAPTAAGPGMYAPDGHDPQDMRNMGGLRSRMPITFWTFLVGTLALTGIPIFAGFWSKDEILADAFHKGIEQGIAIAAFVWVMGTLAAFFTAFYMARQIFMVFFGKPQTEGAQHASESGPAMVYPLIVLAVFAAFLGLAGVPESLPGLGPALGNPFHHFVGALAFGAGEFHALEFNPLPALISIAAAVGGWLLGWLVYGRDPFATRLRDPLSRLGVAWRVLYRKYYIDEIYSATAVRGTIAFAGLNALIDQYVIDMTVNLIGRGGEIFSRVNRWIDVNVVDGAVNLVAILSGEMSRGLRVLQSGRVQQYLLVIAVSLIALVGAYVF